jgi:hypothetical protein
MKHAIIASGMLAASLFGADSLGSWFEEGQHYGNIKYYYIETDKDNGAGTTTSAHANTLGGQLGYRTGKLYGLSAGVTFMTTNPFALPNAVDTSIIGRDNAVQEGLAPGDHVAQKAFSVLGEAYLGYSRGYFDLWYGRKVIKTPVIDAKEVRLLPSSVQGGIASYGFENGITLGAGYLDFFKQRTSDNFQNIVKHALGEETAYITGDEEGVVLPVFVEWHDARHSVRLYDYYAEDFMNAVYIDGVYKSRADGDFSWSASFQGMHQQGIGHSVDAMNADKAKYGGEINARFFGIKGAATYVESTLMLAYTNVLDGDDEHNSLVLPWDGTPLFTNMITSNNLFVSNYGKGLTADSAYIGGTQGFKAAYTQTYGFSGIEGFKSVLSYAQYNNSDFEEAQQDINLVLGYGIGDFSLALKGMWVKNNTSADMAGTVSQLDELTQYRAIANYKF